MVSESATFVVVWLGIGPSSLSHPRHGADYQSPAHYHAVCTPGPFEGVVFPDPRGGACSPEGDLFFEVVWFVEALVYGDIRDGRAVEVHRIDD